MGASDLTFFKAFFKIIRFLPITQVQREGIKWRNRGVSGG